MTGRNKAGTVFCLTGIAVLIRKARHGVPLFMAEDTPDMLAILKSVAESPKRDNSAYHRAIAEARHAFENAEIALGGPVGVQTKTRMKRKGEYVVKWTFRRLDD